MYKHGSNQAGKRTWRRETNGSYMFSVRLRDPLLSQFRASCEQTGMSPSTLMRLALMHLIYDRKSLEKLAAMEKSKPKKGA